MPIRAILFDFIGTTVLEKTPDTIALCFEKTFQVNSLPVPADFIHRCRGMSKREVIQTAIRINNLPEGLVERILNTFEEHIEQSLSNFSSVPDVTDIFQQLRQKGVKIGIGTGLTRDSFHKIMSHLKWSLTNFDYSATSEEIGRGRPHPDMIFDMMKALGIKNTNEFLKVGDTVSDIQEGKNAGVVTAAILSGTQNRLLLEKVKPDFICSQLGEILYLLD